MQRKAGNTEQRDIASLRGYAKYRILNEMIEAVKRNSEFSKEYLIMILDQSAVRVFASVCKFFELYKVGLYHTEILEKKRKKYPKTDAIYFISPKRRSIEILIKDFAENQQDDPNQQTVDHRPHYGCVHLCFTSNVSDELMEMISTCKPLVKRIRSFFVINLDFYFFNDSVFHLGKDNLLPIFKIMCDEDREKRDKDREKWELIK